MALSKADLQKKIESTTKAIKMFDTEGGGDDGQQADGFISKDEMVKILMRPGATALSYDEADQKWKSWLKAFDANGDGKLSVAEVAEALAHSDEVRKLYECCKKGSFGPVEDDVGKFRQLLKSLESVGKRSAPATTSTRLRLSGGACGFKFARSAR